MLHILYKGLGHLQIWESSGGPETLPAVLRDDCAYFFVVYMRIYDSLLLTPPPSSTQHKHELHKYPLAVLIND